VLVALGLLAVGALVVAYLLRRPPPPGPTPQPTPQMAAAAHLTSLEGSVKSRAVDTLAWVPAVQGAALHTGDQVQAVGDSSAEITFADGTLVRMRPGSLLTIEDAVSQPTTASRARRALIVSGDVDFSAPRRGARGGATELSTSAVDVQPRDETAGGLRVSEAGASEVRIFQGEAQIRTRGAAQTVAANQAVRITSQGRASAVVALPAWAHAR
jgi:hypothetical protein